MMKVWGGFMYFIMGALGTLPNFQGVVYRGYPDKKEVEEQYKLGRPIQWSVLAAHTHTLCTQITFLAAAVSVTQSYTSANIYQRRCRSTVMFACCLRPPPPE